MGAAPAEVLFQAANNLLSRGGGVLRQQANRRQHHARRAEPALQSVVLHERLLHRMQFPLFGKALDGHHLLVLNVFHLPQARADCHPVQQHRAGAAVPFPTTELGPRQPQIGAKHPQQQAVSVHVQPHRFVIEFEGNSVTHAVLQSSGHVHHRVRADCKFMLGWFLTALAGL